MQAARQHELSIEAIVDRALRGRQLSREEGHALIGCSEAELPLVLAAAARLAELGHGKVVTFSAKVFVPLTTLCRDDCGYCTFRRDPGEAGASSMELHEVVALCKKGEALGVKEALFSLGDQPEASFPEHRAWLKARGHLTTLGYLREACEAVAKATGLLPHANPGLMGDRDLEDLRRVNASMGLMLESTSERLLRPGAAHHRAPDKVPSRRLRTIEAAGALRIPFTTGILIGIGETLPERIDGLLALRDLHDRYGHIQEIIVQSFRAKPEIRMRAAPDPSFADLERTVATARLLFGAEMNLQAPPNLSPASYSKLLCAGLNDWGGISPLTVDHINPEAAWPELGPLREETARAGYLLRERLCVYPEYIFGRNGFLDDAIRPKVEALVDADGLVKAELERWRD